LITSVVLLLWVLVGVTETVLIARNAGSDQFEWLMYIFSGLTATVLSLTILLTREMKMFIRIAGESEDIFDSERRNVLITSMIFCVGFIVELVKNGLAFRFIKNNIHNLF
jgi:hypothetical protein